VSIIPDDMERLLSGDGFRAATVAVGATSEDAATAVDV
jgi:hypothetical protein